MKVFKSIIYLKYTKLLLKAIIQKFDKRYSRGNNRKYYIWKIIYKMII